MPNKLPADGLSSAETPLGERLKESLRLILSEGSQTKINGCIIEAALLRIEHLEADLAAERRHPYDPVCDEPGCANLVAGGWPSKDGYRNTCRKHWQGAAAEREGKQVNG